MRPFGIYGIGAAGGMGVGMETVVRALHAADPPGRERAGVRGIFAPELPAPALPGGRRFSPWLKMSIAAAQEAMHGLESTAPERLGIVGATAYGSLAHTASFMENMIRRQEAEPQPANFIYSVHNAANTHAAMALQARGFNLTLTHDHTSFEQALIVASRRLSQGQEDRMVVLGADEWHPLLHAVLARFGTWRKRRIPGEGAAALVTGPAAPGIPIVADVCVKKLSGRETPEEERECITKTLQQHQLSWENISLVLAGLGPNDTFTPRVMADWENSRGREIWPYLDWTGFYPTASAMAIAIGAAYLKATYEFPDFFYKNIKKNLHRNVVLIYNRCQVETCSWVIIKL
jgi:hypothetical protein